MSDSEHEAASSGIDRRSFVASAAAVAGISASGVGSAMARSTPDFGRTRFVEVGVEHAHDVPGDRAFDYPLVDNDPMVRYAVDREAGALYLGSFVPDEGVAAFRNEDLVVRARGYGGPGTAAGGRARESLVTELGRQYLPARLLQVATPYAPPEVTVHPGADGVRVTAGGTGLDVDPGGEATATLGARTVEVPVRDDDYREVPDPRSGGTRQVRGVSRVETVTVEPRVRVRDHGRLDVFDASDDQQLRRA